MVTLFNNLSFAHDKDVVSMTDSAQSVGNNDAGNALVGLSDLVN